MLRKLGMLLFQLSMLVYVVLPIILLIIMSFSRTWRWPKLLPSSWGFQSWQYVFSSSLDTWHAITLSMWIAISVTLINILLAIPAAEVLARRKFSGKLWVEILLMAPIIVSPIVSMMGLYTLFIYLSWNDSLFGVILAHVIPTFPYMLQCVRIGYRTLSFQMEEQAMLLGAKSLKRLTHVVLPHLLPSIVAGIGLSMLVSLSQYILTLFLGGGQVMTLSILMFPYVNQGDFTIAATYSVLFSGLALIALYGSSILLNIFYRRGFSLTERR